MRILILNWKDIRHPQSGGAETATHQIARNLVGFGHQVTLFTKQFPNSKTEENIDTVKIYRQGNFWSVYFYAFLYYQKNKNNIDIVIDQIHGIPFFTPLYVKKPILAYIHEIAGSIWFKEFSLLVALIGNLTEKIYFLFYKNIVFLTDTISTKNDLIKKNIKQKNIFIIPLSIEKSYVSNLKKNKIPTLIYIGRITPMKQIDLLIKASYLLKRTNSNLRVIIIGKGKKSYEKYLSKLISDLKLTKDIILTGFVSEKEKYNLLAKSWLLIHPSMKEGYGLTVLEAASEATPTVCFNVPGLRDVVKNNTNGIVVQKYCYDALANDIKELINDSERFNILSQKSRQWFLSLPTWSQQTKKLEKVLINIYKDAS